MIKFFTFSFLFGVLSAIVCFLFFIAEITLNINPLGASKAFGYVLMFAMFFPAIWYFREKQLGGKIHFPQGLLFGSLMNFFACLFNSLLIGLFLTQFNPQVLESHKQESKMFITSMKTDYLKTMSLEAFESGLKSLENITVGDIMWDEFYKRFLILLIFVIIASFIMRRTQYSEEKI
ncbi:MAG: DUF4199 domain-containing protein [Opitutaceae bacterium]|nr:DUF4199 domain-containing protein [Cytophagales bacterium]